MTSLPHSDGPERSETLDAVRGAALVGVLLVNTLVIGGLRFLGPESLAAVHGPLDRAAEFVIAVFVEGKALAAFSLLFGLSFTLLLQGAVRRGEAFTPFFARRLTVLAALGLLNAAAFFWGDILTTYAVIGALLPLAARLGQRDVLLLAVALILVPPLILALAGIAAPAVPTADRASLVAFAAPSLATTIEQNVALFFGAVGSPSGLRLWRYSHIAGLFLIGLWAGRSGLVPAIERGDAGRLVPLAVAAVVVGAVAEAAAAAGLIAGAGRTGLLWAKPLMGAGYAVLVAHLLARPAAAALRRGLAPLGRMALTGYLMGGLLGQAVFYGWGLGLIGRVGTAGVAAIALALAAALALFARLWLARFRFGPWEWLWRRLSRKGTMPLRLR